MFGLAVRLVASGSIEFDAVSAKFVPWDDEKNAFGRPKDYTTFAETWARRSAGLAPM